ncbi:MULTISPECIES: P-type DNA transfer ATPase VirB11 [Burkholderia cepacia complex]|uniref:Type IV secretion system protein n=1 Tax=Burkholderia pseudomultivorans TaxID=1207504 RepID=A0A132EM22_9BURK|nr:MULTISPECIES: P-type DNA transfer ATPase VirB11 [Burkholderia cepacia complex]KWE97914.1 haloacid dehalogenase [Burkholderia ubonensis]KWF37395.1 haloacid dehalogenase [Burkholderia pseudomultivorans]
MSETNVVAIDDMDRSQTVRSLLRQCGIGAFLAAEGVTEVAVNRAGEIAVEGRNGWERHDAPDCSLERLKKLANALVVFDKKGQISAKEPIKPVTLPDGQRGQVMVPPAVEAGTVSITIRIPSDKRFTITQLSEYGTFDGFRDVSTHLDVPADVKLQQFELEMLDAKANRDMTRFFELAIANKLNIVPVGGTGSGKTTLLKALADLVPRDERIGTIEDVHEFTLPYHWNRVHMFFSDNLPARELVRSSLRAKLHRCYISELRGDEAWDYLSLLNTGHAGGLTTVHANDPISAFVRIATLIKQSPVGMNLDWDFVFNEVRRTVDVVLFMETGTKKMTQLFYDPVLKWKLQRGQA